MSNIFITGGTGFVGMHLIKRLLEEGHYIKVLVRKTSNISNLKSKNIKLIIGDIEDLSSFISEIHGQEIVYHLAGVVTDWAPKKLFEKVHIQGTRNLLEASLKAKVKIFIHMSTLDVLEKKKKDDHFIIHENAPYSKSKSPYIVTKTSAEKLVISYFKEKGLNIVIFRPVWIYGPGDKTLFPEIAYQLKKGNMMFIGSPNNLIQLVFIDNIINYLILAMQKETMWGHIFTVCDSEKISIKELCDLISNKLGYKRVSMTIPYSIAYTIAAILELISHIIRSERRPLLTRTAVEMLGESVEIDNVISEKLLPYIPKVSLLRGIEKTIAWLKNDDIRILKVK